MGSCGVGRVDRRSEDRGNWGQDILYEWRMWWCPSPYCHKRPCLGPWSYSIWGLLCYSHFASEGYVWVYNPIADEVYVNIHGLSYHQMTSVSIWSVLPLAAISWMPYWFECPGLSPEIMVMSIQCCHKEPWLSSWSSLPLKAMDVRGLYCTLKPYQCLQAVLQKRALPGSVISFWSWTPCSWSLLLEETMWSMIGASWLWRSRRIIL